MKKMLKKSKYHLMKKMSHRRKSSKYDSRTYQIQSPEANRRDSGEPTVQFYKVSCWNGRTRRKVITFVIFVEQLLCSRMD